MALVPNEGHFDNDKTKNVKQHSMLTYSQNQLDDQFPINYEKLKQLLSIDGLKEDGSEHSSEEAHREFMKSYKKVFIKAAGPQRLPAFGSGKEKHQQTSIPTDKSTGPTLARSTSSDTAETLNESPVIDSHDVREYTKHLRKQRSDEVNIALKTDGVKILRKMLRKLPFQRTTDDINVMYKVLKTFPNFAGMLSNKVLKELCYVAQLDQWKDEEFPVFGSCGMHMVLKGSVVTQTSPYIFPLKQSLQEFLRDCSNAKHSLTEGGIPKKILGVGECFGTFKVIDGQTMHKSIMMVETHEPNCEFLKVTTSDFSRVIEQIKMKEQTRKLNLIQACDAFKDWTRQPKLKLANLIEWAKFPPNTVIVSEGCKAPFIGFVLSGECHVLKQLEVLHMLQNGEQERKIRQVVMGKLGTDQSFAELSLLKEEPMTCSIITATDVELGTISPTNLFGLDETTLQLLQQSCQPTFDNLSQERIHEEYIDQELKREWNQYRHNAVIEAINAHGIRPGYGKWKKC